MKRAEGCEPRCEFADGVGSLETCQVICQRLRWDTIDAKWCCESFAAYSCGAGYFLTHDEDCSRRVDGLGG